MTTVKNKRICFANHPDLYTNFNTIVNRIWQTSNVYNFGLTAGLHKIFLFCSLIFVFGVFFPLAFD